MTEGENASDLSSSLTLRISNENCGESDLTAEHMAEGISSSLDFGSAFKIGNCHEQGQMSLPIVFNSEGTVKRSRSRERGNATHSKSCRFGSEKDAGMGKWLELGLGSIDTGSKCPQLAQHNHVSFTQDSSPTNKEHTSRLNTRNQPFIPKLNTQIDCHFPQRLTQTCYGRGMASTLPSSSSCDLDRNRLFCSPKTKFLAQYPLHKHAGRQFEERHSTIIKTSGDNFINQNSEQSAVLQNVRDIIQSRRQWSSNGDFAWTRSSDFRPTISDMSVGRKLPPNGLTATIQYQSPQCIQPLMTCKAQQKQTSAQFTGMQSFTTNISQTENAKVSKPRKREGEVWFMLKVAATKDEDRLLQQIPKTYLRIKDGTITILLVKKYLASKLGLKSESEIEITCRGQTVLPFLTLQHVRDEIWFSSMKKDAGGQQESSKSKMTTGSFLSKHSNECLMILNYQRSSSGHYPSRLQYF